MKVLDRFVHRQLTVAVFNDHAAADHVHLRNMVQVDSPLVAELPQGERLVVEVLGAHQRDAEHHGVNAMGAGRPTACLHGTEPLYLAGRPDDGDSWLAGSV